MTMSQSRVIWVVVVGAVVFGMAGVLIFPQQRIAPPSLKISGRIEGDEAVLAAKVGGRIREIRLREGDRVGAGGVVALLDDAELQAEFALAKAELDEALAVAESNRLLLNILRTRIRAEEAAKEQSELDSRGKVTFADAELRAAEAMVAQAEARAADTQTEATRLEKLAAAGVFPQQNADRARETARADAAALHATRQNVEAARAAVTIAEAGSRSPFVQGLRILTLEEELQHAQSRLNEAVARVERARAALAGSTANLANLTIRAPFEGTVITRSAEPGEVVSSGTAILTVVNLAELYLRGFLPEGQIGLVRVGQNAEVFLDSAPDTPLSAVVSRIDPEATFTPENTYFQEDRVRQVFGLKLRLNDSAGFAKPGMPADANVLLDAAK
jgi:HlyD family secretion protein